MGALSDLVIADFSRVLAGPYATMMLADFGAEVIKVERLGTGDDTRTWGPPFAADGTSTYFQSINRNKNSVTADLTTDAGIAIAHKIISRSSVVVENFAPGTMEKFGLGYEELSRENPGLIYVAITGFGSGAKARELPGYDLLVQGMSGLMSITGEDSDHPTKVGVALIDVIAGLHAALAITTALHHRAKSGQGQKIEVNLMSSALSAMVNQSTAFIGAGVVPNAMGNAHPSIAPYESFKASDGHLIIAVGNDKQFALLLEVLNLRPDPRFATNTERVKNRKELHELISQALSTKTVKQWSAQLMAVGVPAGPILTIEGAIETATNLGLQPVIDVAGSKTIANPIIFSKTPVEYRKAPPSLGQDD
ncbi:MAG: CoA transferase [Actinobacteria bacterium]|nr:CoA transferase [Actinomycetota bacterium]